MGNVGKHAVARPFAARRRRSRHGTILMLAVVAIALTASGAVTTKTYASQPTALVTIYPDSARPATTESGDHNAVELGVRFQVSAPGAIVAIRFFKAAINTGTHTGTLWTGDGHRMSNGTLRSETASGWQTIELPRHVHVVPGRVYVASYNAPNGRYSQTEGEFSAGHRVGNSMISAMQGTYAYGHGSFPQASWKNSGYGVDVEFLPGDPGSSTPTPAPSSSVPTSSTPTAAPSTRASPSATPSATTSSSPAPSTSASSTSAPSATPTTPSPSPSSSLPPLSSFPNDSNTGVPSGTSLRNVPGDVSSGTGWHWDTRGWVVIDGAGATFSGFRERGGVDVRAANVTISNNDIYNDGEGFGVGLRAGAVNTTIQDNTIHGPCLVCTDRLTYGIDGDLGGGAGLRMLRNKFYYIDHPIQVEQGLVQDNYAHLLATNGATDHVDVFFSGGSVTAQLTIRHNSFMNDYTQDGTTASIILSNAFGVQSNRLIEDNLLAGGGYTVYGGAGDSSGVNVVIRNNFFSTQFNANSGYYGPVIALLSGPTNSFTNNRWYDGPRAGQLIRP